MMMIKDNCHLVNPYYMSDIGYLGAWQVYD